MKTNRITAVLGFILLSTMGLSGCGNREYVQMTPDNTTSAPLYETPAEFAPAEDEISPQLTALADSLEEAQEIADLYGIELDSYSYGVAAYTTDKDIAELLLLGEKNNYPTLAPNQTSEINTDTAQ